MESPDVKVDGGKVSDSNLKVDEDERWQVRRRQGHRQQGQWGDGKLGDNKVGNSKVIDSIQGQSSVNEAERQRQNTATMRVSDGEVGYYESASQRLRGYGPEQ